MVYTRRFSSSKCSLFHNSNIFGSVLFTFYIQGVLKLKKIIPAPKGYSNDTSTLKGRHQANIRTPKKTVKIVDARYEGSLLQILSQVSHAVAHAI